MNDLVSESEGYVLGAAMVDPGCWDRIAGKCDEGDFSSGFGRAIFRTIRSKVSKGEQYDSTIIANAMRDGGEIEQREWSDVASLTVYQVGTSTVEAHAETVREWANRRRLREALNTALQGWATTPAEETAALVAKAAANVATVSAGDTVLFADALQEAYTWISEANERKRTGKAVGITTGLPALDNWVGGFMPGELIAVAARTSVGKTAALNAMALHAASKGEPGLIISLEENSASIAMRSIASYLSKNISMLRFGHENAKSVEREVDETALGSLPLWINTNTEKLSAILALISEWRRKHNITWAAVDHIGLVDAESGKMQRNEQVGVVTRALKQLAQRLDIPLIAVVQLNREAADKRPELQHLAESGNIERDINTGIFINRKSAPIPQQPIEIEIGVLKQRYGITGWIPNTYHFHGKFQRFEELP